jgi:hypothetical protein
MGLVSFLNAIDRTRMERTGAQFYADRYGCGPSIEDEDDDEDDYERLLYPP